MVCAKQRPKQDKEALRERWEWVEHAVWTEVHFCGGGERFVKSGLKNATKPALRDTAGKPPLFFWSRGQHPELLSQRSGADRNKSDAGKGTRQISGLSAAVVAIRALTSFFTSDAGNGLSAENRIVPLLVPKPVS
jgi:hypothetical protein